MTRGAVLALLGGLALPVSACGRGERPAVLALAEARRLVGDMRLQRSRGGSATNAAVLADTDEASKRFADEAEGAMATLSRDASSLAPLLADLDYAEEAALLQEFEGRLAAYRTLDGNILALAVENTNLKAQRRSFGPAAEAAEAFGAALRRLSQAPARTRSGASSLAAPLAMPCALEVLAERALLAVRRIQVLQAPHIAEASDEKMTALEAEMKAAEGVAREALNELVALRGAGSGAEAEAALSRFLAENAEIVRLSRRNSNVRSLAMAVGEKPLRERACDEVLERLQQALSQRGHTATR